MIKVDRKKLFQIHSWIGIKLSVLFFIVCFSGTLATLSHEMDWLFIPEIRANPKGANSQVELASRNQMADNVHSAYPEGKIVYWQTLEEPYLCNIIHLMLDGHRRYVFANPYTGEVQGMAHLTFQRFFRDLHYYLFIPFQFGHFTVLIFGFMLLVSLLTALLFYKKWYRKLFELKTGRGAIVFFRSLHRLVGVWSVPFTILFSVTGIWYFVERANVGGVSDIANTVAPPLVEPIADSLAFVKIQRTIDYDQAVKVAQQEIEGLAVKDILPPANATSALYLTGKSSEPLVRNRANRVYLHPITLEVLKVQRASALPTVTWLNDIADPLHFGNWGGLVTKIIWFLLGLGISSLVLTGIWISQKRKVKGAVRIRAQKMGPWKYVNWTVYGVMLGFMYTLLVTQYQASFTVLLLITIGWMIFIGTAWYIFEYRLPKVAKKELLSHA
ncbi:MAG: PepSY-associated TM helix domain-containing protein [Tunicatimonas sp.]|uniref:PepSY-associated TM helix domain-containing protein n=1 Tax=Tunicatimonas sp. TaxID=1940096 RepID=UPI003C71DA3E